MRWPGERYSPMRRVLTLILLILGSGTLFAALPLDTSEGIAPSTATAAGEADLKILDHYVACLDLNGNTVCDPDEPVPLEIPVSEDVTIIIKETIHNNGPDNVGAEVTGIATVPPDCEILDPVHVQQIPFMPVSVTMPIKEAFTIHCLQPSEHTFTFDNEIAPKDPLVIDPNTDNNTAPTEELTVVAIGQADLEIVNQRIVVWPTDLDVNENAVVTLETDVRNNGTYGPVEAQFEGWLQAPTHCTVEPTAISQQVVLAANETQTIQQEFTIQCAKHCLRTFVFHNRVMAKAPHIPDTQPENNERSRFLPSIRVWVKADVEIVSQRVTNPPTDIDVSQNVPVTVQKVLRNNGPYPENVTVEILRTASAPPDCTVTPSDPVSEEVTLPYNVTVVKSEDYVIHCSAESSHTFSFDNEVEIHTLHVRDPEPGNNQAHTELPVAAWTQADVRISSQQLVEPPTEIDVSENAEVTLRKTLHNNGGYGPVDVSITTNVSGAPDCSATRNPANPTSANLPVSTDVVIEELWTIHCDHPSEHTFSFNNSIAITTPHVEDPVPVNNAASSGLTLIARAQADVEISSQEIVDPPTEIPVSEDVDVTLRKTLHNNGGYGPVAVSITTNASGLPDCSATPDPANPTSANLPVSTDVVVDELWTIHCDEPSEHTFSFDNSIAITTPHVDDPSPVNSASTELVVAAIAQADVKITGQEIVDPPSSILEGKEVGITLRKHVRNDGPYGPVDISISSSATAPTNCTVSPSDQGLVLSGVATSEERVVNEDWTISCSEAGEYTFTFANSIDVVAPEHVQGSDSLETELQVTVTRHCGDVDCDGDVDAVDALFIAQYIVALKLPSDQCPPPEGYIYLPAGDVDCDDDVDAVDALFVLQYVVGLRPDLCVCPEP